MKCKPAESISSEQNISININKRSILNFAFRCDISLFVCLFSVTLQRKIESITFFLQLKGNLDIIKYIKPLDS